MTAPLVRRYVASGLAGLLAGAGYCLLEVPSPAPPWTALTGLLGLLLGEHATRALLGRIRSHRNDHQQPQARRTPPRPPLSARKRS